MYVESINFGDITVIGESIIWCGGWGVVCYRSQKLFREIDRCIVNHRTPAVLVATHKKIEVLASISLASVIESY